MCSQSILAIGRERRIDVPPRPNPVFMSLHRSLSLERRKATGPLLSGALGPARMAF